MALARRSRSCFSSFRSNVDGGKKTSACGPRHAALTCQVSSVRRALIPRAPPFDCWPRTVCPSVVAVKGKFRNGRSVVGSVAVVASGAFEGFDLEDEPVDGRDPHRLAVRDGGGAVGPG